MTCRTLISSPFFVLCISVQLPITGIAAGGFCNNLLMTGFLAWFRFISGFHRQFLKIQKYHHEYVFTGVTVPEKKDEWD
jgi:hypothetical protein